MFRHIILTATFALAAMTTHTARCADTGPAIAFSDYQGTVGSAPVGLTIGVTDGKIAQGSHYYYRKYLKDIPLTGTTGPEIRLTEPGGGAFTLHYVDNKGQPATQNTSTGLAGTWSDNDRTLPVTLSEEGSQTYAPGHRYAEITDEPDSKLEATIKGFYDAALAGKPDIAARFVAFPLRVNTGAGHYFTINDATTLEQKWHGVFSTQWLKDLARTSPHDLPVIQANAMIGNGLAFFGEKGLSIVNTRL